MGRICNVGLVLRIQNIIYMKYLYHYTKFDCLFPNDKAGIIHPNEIRLWARHHSFFNNGEYTWIKDNASNAISELCQKRGWKYDSKEDYISPCIISFCENGDSQRMWKAYANMNRGVQLVFDYDEIVQCILNSHYVDSLCKCSYLKHYNSIAKLKNIIAGKYYMRHYVTPSLQNDFTIQAVSLKQFHFKNEQELRYIRSFPVEFTFDESGISEATPLPSRSVFEATDDEFLILPHKVLKKIVIGSNATQYDDDRLGRYFSDNSITIPIERMRK